MTRRKKIYLASPLFSPAERSVNDQLARRIERHCDLFLPQRDGELVPTLVHRGLSRDEAYRVVFERYILAIRGCDAVVVNLDGRSVDAGAAFELGFAYALGKLCIGYRTDVRVLLPWGLNPMLEAPLINTFGCIESLEAWAMEFAKVPGIARPRLVSG